MRSGVPSVRVSFGSGLVKCSRAWLTLESREDIACGQAPSRSRCTLSLPCLYRASTYLQAPEPCSSSPSPGLLTSHPTFPCPGCGLLLVDSHQSFFWFLSFLRLYSFQLSCPLPCPAPATTLLNGSINTWEDTDDGAWMLVLSSVLLVL